MHHRNVCFLFWRALFQLKRNVVTSNPACAGGRGGSIRPNPSLPPGPRRLPEGDGNPGLGALQWRLPDRVVEAGVALWAQRKETAMRQEDLSRPGMWAPTR